jgi:predicted aspartyl protease
MILDLADAAGAALIRILAVYDADQERAVAVVKSLSSALNESKAYLSDRRNGKPANRDTEKRLANLWDHAAADVRPIDIGLSDRLRNKADAWADPPKWSDKDIEEAGIRIEQISEQVNKLLSQVDVAVTKRNLVQRLIDMREKAIALVAIVYVLGYLVWSFHAWQNDLGLLPALDAQYLVAGAIPFGILIAAYYISKALGHFFLIVWPKLVPVGAKGWRWFLRNAAQFVFAVGFSSALLGGVVESLSESISDILFLIGVTGVTLGLVFAPPPEDPDVFKKQSRDKSRSKWLRRLLGVRYFFATLANGFSWFYKRFWASYVAFTALVIGLVFYLERVYPNIPQDFGGVRPRVASLDVDRSALSDAAAYAILPTSAVEQSGGISRTKKIDVLHVGRGAISIRLHDPLRRHPTLEIAASAVHAIEWDRGENRVTPRWRQSLGYMRSELHPIELKGRMPVVRAVVNTTEVQMLFDTGNMSRLAVPNRVAEELKLQVVDQVRMYDGKGTQIGTSPVYTMDSLKVFGDTLFDQRAVTSGIDIGLIGPHFVDGGRFTLDTISKCLAISSTRLPEDAGANIIPLVKSSEFDYLIVVHGFINGRSVLMEIDTGKSRSVIDPELAKELSLPVTENGYRIGAVGLGTLTFEVPSAKASSLRGISDGLPEPMLAGIGADILSQVLFTVDYTRGIVVIDRGAN